MNTIITPLSYVIHFIGCLDLCNLSDIKAYSHHITICTYYYIRIYKRFLHYALNTINVRVLTKRFPVLLSGISCVRMFNSHVNKKYIKCLWEHYFQTLKVVDDAVCGQKISRSVVKTGFKILFNNKKKKQFCSYQKIIFIKDNEAEE